MAEDHSFAEYTVDVEPTCTTEGSKSIHCHDCDATKDSEPIPATGHIPSNKSPQTGDDGTLLWLIMLIVSALVFTSMAAYSRKKKFHY